MTPTSPLRMLVLSIVASLAPQAESTEGPRRGPEVAPAPPGTARPADAIVEELDALLRRARRPLPGEEHGRVHGGIVAAAGELRATHPADPRVGRYLPERWYSLLYLRRYDQARAEVDAALGSAADPALRASAGFVDASLRLLHPIDGPAAADLAERFARQAPGDPRAAQVLAAASAKLAEGRDVRLGLGLLWLAAAGLLALGRRGWGRAARGAGLGLALALVAVVALAATARGGLAGAVAAAFEATNDPGWARHAAGLRMIAGRAATTAGAAISGGRAVGVLLLAGAVAGVAHAARRRRAVPGATPRFAWRRGAVDLLAALGLLCLADAGLLALRGHALRARVVREYPDSFRGRLARGEDRRERAVGAPFELEFTDAISGRRVAMRDLRGKVVVVEFWATWCGPCVAEVPDLLRLYEAYRGRGVEFIGVSLDAPEVDGGLAALRAFVAERGIPWPQYHLAHSNQGAASGAPTGDFAEAWGVAAVPTTFVIDAEGRLASTEARGRLDTLIPRLLEARRGPSRAGAADRP